VNFSIKFHQRPSNSISKSFRVGDSAQNRYWLQRSCSYDGNSVKEYGTGEV